MLTLTNLNPKHYIEDLDTFLFDISIVSTIATVYSIFEKCKTTSFFAF